MFKLQRLLLEAGTNVRTLCRSQFSNLYEHARVNDCHASPVIVAQRLPLRRDVELAWNEVLLLEILLHHIHVSCQYIPVPLSIYCCSYVHSYPYHCFCSYSSSFSSSSCLLPAMLFFLLFRSCSNACSSSSSSSSSSSPSSSSSSASASRRLQLLLWLRLLHLLPYLHLLLAPLPLVLLLRHFALYN